MAQYTNAQILSAVVSKWIEPVIQTFGTAQLQTTLGSMPMVATAENWLKQMGFASPNYSLATELSGYADLLSGQLVTEMLNEQVSKLDDAGIPAMAHSFADKMIEKGEITLLEGKFLFDATDLQKLKSMLDLNLPLNEQTKGYEVIME